MGKIALSYQALGSVIFSTKRPSSVKNKNVIEVWDEISFSTYSLILNFLHAIDLAYTQCLYFPFICIFCY